MNNLLKGSQKFLKKNSATILTCAGAVGVVATAVSTAKAATKASKLLEQVEAIKGEELTAQEKIKIAAPIYIPAVLFGAATITCIFSANILNQRKQASLIGAYTLLDSSYKNYQSKVKEMYGSESHELITDEIVKENMDNAPIIQEPEKELFYDLYSGRYFESSNEDVLRAEAEMNKIMHTDCGVGLNEFYSLLGLKERSEFNELGWTSVAMQDMYWHAWIEFDHRKVIMDDGLECTTIEFPFPPIIDYLEY